MEAGQGGSHPMGQMAYGEWLPIPEHVPRALIETCAWVRAQAATSETP